MWIVRLALRRPYTFVVMSILILVLGIRSILTMSTDIFPDINIPVVSVIWAYGGLSPDDMEKRIISISERAMTTTVNGIEHLESQSMNGVGVIKVFFQPGVKIESAVAEVTSIQQTIVRVLPPGATPPLIIRYSASSVPVLQLSVKSESQPENVLYDQALNFIRQPLATVQGASIPLPFGGKARQIMVDLNLEALEARGLSPVDVSNALNAQNLTLPSGTMKMGDRDYTVRLNSSPDAIALFNDLPIRTTNGITTYMRDVASVHDGAAVQANIVRENGVRSALLSVLKSQGASTLDIVKRVKARLAQIKPGLIEGLEVKELFDQSVFVSAAIHGVFVEGLIAACLTATMILIFLGSWRSTLIIAGSIPLSILVSILALDALGYTINVMTLGGLSLAVGILVDDATVAIENIHRNLGLKERKSLLRAILDGSEQIAMPAFVSTLAICIVFVSVVFLTGPARFLFVPLALAVAFAMMASYLLSRTLVPVMVKFLLGPEVEAYSGGEHGTPSNPSIIWRIHDRFNHHFENFRGRYHGFLESCLAAPKLTVFCFLAAFGLSFLLIPFIGRDFFPTVDAGQFRLHIRAPVGTRIEEVERLFGEVGDYTRTLVPAGEISIILDNIGLPSGGVNLAFSDSATIGSSDGEMLVSLRKDHDVATGDLVKRLRRELPARFPGVAFFFQPADIVSQILNFGLPAAIDVQVSGPPKNAADNFKIAQALTARISQIPGAVDVTLKQVVNAPQIDVKVDRQRATLLGLSQGDVANSLLVSTSGSGQVARNYWLNPVNGVNYLVAVQTPQYRVDSLNALSNTPITGITQPTPQLLTNLATTSRSITPVAINHYNIQPTFDIFASAQDRDLGGVSSDINKVVAEFSSKLPKGSTVIVRGQVESMNSAFSRLGLGIVFAVMMIYFLMVVNFQSWIDPLIIIGALPGAASGILWILFATHTTFSVPSLMGTIMCIGVATANAILLITFANDLRLEGKDATAAALEAGSTRLRPVLMTALAMILGMIPMSLGLGEGGEQNAPLGRAVIGGLLIATVTTLLFVPVIYSLFRKKPPATMSEEEMKYLSEEKPVELQTT